MTTGTTHFDFKFTDHSKQVAARIEDGIRMGLTMNATEFLAVSSTIVPVRTGNLRDTAEITYPANGNTLVRVIGYADDKDTLNRKSGWNYGVIQYFHSDYKHKKGQRAFWMDETQWRVLPRLKRVMIAALSYVNNDFRTKTSQKTYASYESSISGMEDSLIGSSYD